MSLPPEIVARLRLGRAVAAEVPARPDARAYVVIIPQAPDRLARPGLWLHANVGEPRLRDAGAITGYEIRRLQHDARYTDAEWGWDYDHVLADPTTRVGRIFVRTADEIGPALAPWIALDTVFRHPDAFDGSLVSSPIDSYLDRADAFPHLWLDP